MTTSRETALRAGIRAEIFTVGWMVIEAAVAIASGIAASSVLLVAFGADSVIELMSGAVLLWRLHAEVTDESATMVERRAAWVSSILLVVLCLYVVTSSVVGLVRHVEPEKSVAGIVISAAAVIAMPLLGRWKKRINSVLQSSALRADIAETLACGLMAAFVLLGLVLNVVLRWWWAEYVAAFGLLFWLLHETKEAFEAARGDAN